MKYAFASALAALTIAGAAIAQPAPTAPTPPTPPAVATATACPAYPAAPPAPSADSLRNQRDLNAGTETVNSYLAAYQVVHNCRITEVQNLKATLDARVGEAKAAQDGALAYRAAWQATADAVTARAAKKR